MPTISFSLKDLQNLVGKKLTIDEVQELACYGKGEFEGYDKASDEVKIDFGDTNLPYLWSVEGVARLFKNLLGKQKGIPKIKRNKADYRLIVDSSVSSVRPYISAFVAKGHKIDDYLIKQLIGLQEKLCENYGRKREKVAIGVYKYEKIKFPVHYKAADPESVKFMPLDFRKEMTQREILEEHPTGKEYAWILKDAKKYPLLLDSNNSVLSFPPIINSAVTGKIEENDENLFFEATGTNMEAILLATNIFAQALYERGFEIYSVDIKYPTKTITTPHLFNETIKIKKEQINHLLGLELKDSDIKKLLEKLQYEYAAGKIKIPAYRKDILHQVDIIEDIAISYGYDNIKELPLKTFTMGSTFKITEFINKAREILVGQGCQEILSPILTNKNILCDKMNIADFGTVEIENFMSETYSCLRSWILPVLLEVLSKNKHVEYPQKIFEEGVVTVKKDSQIKDYRRIALVYAANDADYTKIKQILDELMGALGFKYAIEEAEHSSFIEGRVGRVIANGKKVAYIGEINPKVLENFRIETPVAGFELNLCELFNSM